MKDADLQQRLINLERVLVPFANLGAALVRHGPHDNSPWIDIPDSDVILRGGLSTKDFIARWQITAYQLRRAYIALYGGEQLQEPPK